MSRGRRITVSYLPNKREGTKPKTIEGRVWKDLGPAGIILEVPGERNMRLIPRAYIQEEKQL